MRLLFLALTFFIFSSSLWADRGLQLKKMKEESRLALVIGNNNYKKLSRLKNPINDARAMRDALKKRGFKVIYKEDATKHDMQKLVKKFAHQLAPNGIGMYFFAGHGINVEGKNYLVGIDSAFEDEDEVPYQTLALDYLTKKMKNGKSRLNIIVLDACRNNPFGRSGGGGLAPVGDAKGTFVAYATGSGKVASDGKSGKNGLFTKHLIRSMNKAGAGLSQVFKNVRQSVNDDSNGKQFPEVSDQTLGEFYFTLPKETERVQKRVKRVKKAQKSSSFSFSDSAPVSYALTVNTTPSNADIVITNVSFEYRDGMELEAGSYEVQVSRSGYYSKTGTVDLQSDLSINIKLKRKKQRVTKRATQSKQTSSSQRTSRGIYRDRASGLIWQNNSNIVKRTWSGAKSYCRNLSHAGFADWHLPNKDELETIVDNNRKIKIAAAFKEVESLKYKWLWSSSSFDADKAWNINFTYALTTKDAKSMNMPVRCVRSNPRRSYSKKSSQGIYKDSSSGLMWQNTPKVDERRWTGALAYCKKLTLGGYSDWYLPNKKNLESIEDTSQTPKIKSAFKEIGALKYPWLWSSNENSSNNKNAWNVNYTHPLTTNDAKSMKMSIRCVRQP